MSVAYAAPEQVSGEAITIATDIYGLGALLHEILSGRSPHAAAEGSLPRLVDAIARGTPTLPSVALAADPTARPWRPTHLKGDLDLIVANCLKREPERRYASAAAVSDDLRRWRERLPIAARRDSAGYRARRFVARHPLGTAFGAVAIA
jgi:serine/threonine-protein kinase